ncbi:MAG: XrtA system polysaccharide deacetylase [Phycisphaerae bacterium]
MTSDPQRSTHLLTFDLEAWFHAHNLGIPARDWPSLPMRLEAPVEQILELLARHQTRATFFVLGWVARQQPHLIERIQQAGHEIASHGYAHIRVDELNHRAFADDVATAKRVLEDITSAPIVGYRAPSYSIGAHTSWALDVLREQGFLYDSSIYPVRAPHGRYGLAGAPRHPYLLSSGLWEIPLPTVKLLGCRMPALTGGYLRHLPWWVNALALKDYERAGIPATINLHPWELDPDQPRQPVPWAKRWLHYGRLHVTHRRLERLVQRAEFTSVIDWLRKTPQASTGTTASAPKRAPRDAYCARSDQFEPPVMPSAR